MELAYKKGFYKTTVDELAAQAGISKRTIYRYFRSKDELIEEILENFMLQMSTELEAILSTKNTPEEIVDSILNQFFQVGEKMLRPVILEDLYKHYPHYWRKMDQFRTQKAFKLIQTIMNQQNQASINPLIISTAVIACIQSVLNPEFIIKNNLTFTEVLEQLLDFFKYGILSERIK